MRKLIGSLVLLCCALAGAQVQPTPTPVGPVQGSSNLAGTLYASNMGQWKVPQGNLGQFSWNQGIACQPTAGGISFTAFTVGTPVEIVDTDNPALNETVTPTSVTILPQSCSINISPVNGHSHFYFTSATGGLQETINWAGTTPYTVILTPDWGLLGGTTGTITSAKGNSDITILDERTAVLGAYTWNGSAYVLTGTSSAGCLGGNAIANGCTGATTAAGAWANITGGAQTGSGSSTNNSFAGSLSVPVTLRGQYDLKDAGALSNGTSDPNIATIFAAAQTAGNIIHIPAGEFNSQTIITITQPNFTVQCDGSKSHLYTDAAVDLIEVGASGVKILNCFLENKNTANPGGQNVVNILNLLGGNTPTDLSFRGNFISGGVGNYTAGGIGMSATGMQRIDISQNTFAHLLIAVHGAPVAGDADPVNVNILNNRMYDLTAYGVDLNYPITTVCCGHSAPVPQYTAAHNFIIAHNQIEANEGTVGDLNSGFGIAVAGADYVQIDDNQIVSRYQGIHIATPGGDRSLRFGFDSRGRISRGVMQLSRAAIRCGTIPL